MRKIIYIALFLGACDSDPLAPTEQEEPTEEPTPSVVVATPVPTEEEPTEVSDCGEEPAPGQNCYCSFLCRMDDGTVKLWSKFEFASDETEACGLIPDHISCEVLNTCYCTCDPA